MVLPPNNTIDKKNCQHLKRIGKFYCLEAAKLYKKLLFFTINKKSIIKGKLMFFSFEFLSIPKIVKAFDAFICVTSSTTRHKTSDLPPSPWSGSSTKHPMHNMRLAHSFQRTIVVGQAWLNIGFLYKWRLTWSTSLNKFSRKFWALFPKFREYLQITSHVF